MDLIDSHMGKKLIKINTLKYNLKKVLKIFLSHYFFSIFKYFVLFFYSYCYITM